jgi:hypothetical protein
MSIKEHIEKFKRQVEEEKMRKKLAEIDKYQRAALEAMMAVREREAENK